jgi:hypothetical protein
MSLSPSGITHSDHTRRPLWQVEAILFLCWLIVTVGWYGHYAIAILHPQTLALHAPMPKVPVDLAILNTVGGASAFIDYGGAGGYSVGEAGDTSTFFYPTTTFTTVAPGTDCNLSTSGVFASFVLSQKQRDEMCTIDSRTTIMYMK